MMKASELIEELETFKDVEGDVEVKIWIPNADKKLSIDRVWLVPDGIEIEARS